MEYRGGYKSLKEYRECMDEFRERIIKLKMTDFPFFDKMELNQRPS